MNDYTPGPVCRQGMSWIKLWMQRQRIPVNRFLDPSAGSGIFGKVAAELFPTATRIGIEPDPLERWWAQQNYDKFVHAYFEQTKFSRPFDLIATNPPFHSWEEFVERAFKMLSPAGVAMFLGLTSWGARSRRGVELFKRLPPCRQLRITGTIGYRGGSSCDQRDYCWWVFSQKHASGEWITCNLERLTAQQRRWEGKVKPGREKIASYGADATFRRNSDLGSKSQQR